MLHSRMSRVAESIKQQLGEIIDRLVTDPRVPDFVTVYSVKVTKDLRTAQVNVTFLDDESPEAIAEAVTGLNQARRFIRGELSHRISLKYVPELHFHYNASTRYAADIERVFKKLEPEEGEGAG